VQFAEGIAHNNCISAGQSLIRGTTTVTHCCICGPCKNCTQISAYCLLVTDRTLKEQTGWGREINNGEREEEEEKVQEMEQRQKELGTTRKKRSKEVGEEGREEDKMECEERKEKRKNRRNEKNMSIRTKGRESEQMKGEKQERRRNNIWRKEGK
jgi:hypothetical protein